MNSLLNQLKAADRGEAKHPKCQGCYDEWQGDYDCEYKSTLYCDQCKYGLGGKDPEAKCNQ